MMDWRLVGSTFVLVFLAELGDKTQLAALGLAATTHRPVATAVGAIAGLATSTILAVTVGQALADVVPADWVRRGAGILFIVSGALILGRG